MTCHSRSAGRKANQRRKVKTKVRRFRDLLTFLEKVEAELQKLKEQAEPQRRSILEGEEETDTPIVLESDEDDEEEKEEEENHKLVEENEGQEIKNKE